MPRTIVTLPPKIDTIRVSDLSDSDGEELEAHESYQGLRFGVVDLTERQLPGIEFSECEFVEVTAHNTDFRAASFSDTTIRRLNAPIFTGPRSSFRGVVIDGSRIGSAEFYEADWSAVHFKNCKLGFVNLRSANLQNVLFTDCSIDELDLGGVRADRVSFIDTRVNNLDVSRSTLKNVDLRGLDINSISGLEGLSGATMSSSQILDLAPILASSYGIRSDG